MHSLEVIIALNGKAATQESTPCVPQSGWDIEHDGHGQISVTGHGQFVTVDCSNPLLDEPLVDFHRQHQHVMPDWVRYRVESIASEYRRTIIVSGGWEACQREAKQHRQPPDNQQDSSIITRLAKPADQGDVNERVIR